MRLTRRLLLAGIATGPAFSWPVSAFAAVDPWTVLSAANAGLSTLRGFAGAGGGLEAMLQAQNAKLNIIINQLGQIQTDLVKLQIKVDELPDQFQGFLRADYREQLITDLVGGASQFANLVSSTKYDPAALRGSFAVTELQEIVSTTTRQRNTLMVSNGGVSPEAATVTPLALALELAAMGHLGTPTSRMLATLDDYENWLNRFDSADPTAIWSEIKKAQVAHDQVIDQMAVHPLGKMTGIAAAKMGSTEAPSGTVRDPCSLVCNINTDPDQFPVPDDKTLKLVRYFCARGWGLERMLDYDPNSEWGVRFLRYVTIREGIIVAQKGDVCLGTYAGKNQQPDTYPESRIRDLAAGKAGRMDASRDAFNAQIAELNYYRARVGYCVRAQQLLQDVRRQARQYRHLLEVA